MGFRSGLILFLCSDIVVNGLIVDGHFGLWRAETTFVVNEKVSWKDAADLCNLRLQGEGGLLYKDNLDVFKNYLIYFRHILQQNGWPLSDHIWTAFVFNGVDVWQRSRYSDSCRDISTQYNDFFPDPPKGYTKCLLLNMTGSSEDHVYIFGSCNEQYGYFCRPKNSLDPATTELTTYPETSIHTDVISNITTVITSKEGSLDNCLQNKLHKNILAFAIMYFTSNQTCMLLSTKPYMLPVSIELLADNDTTTVVKQNSPSLAIVESENVQVKTSLYQDCLGTLENSSNAEPVSSTTDWTSQSPKVMYGTSENPTDNGCQGYCQTQCFNEDQPHWKTDPSSPLNNIKLNKKLLSSYRRRHRSEPDDRLSAFLIGLSGVFVLMLAALVIIVPDVTNHVKQCKSQRQKRHVSPVTSSSHNDVPYAATD